VSRPLDYGWPGPGARGSEYAALSVHMLHTRVVFGRCWACVWRGACGRGDDGGAGWYALLNEEEASTDAVCSQDCQE
jgi:hypothetical protein